MTFSNESNTEDWGPDGAARFAIWNKRAPRHGIQSGAWRSRHDEKNFAYQNYRRTKPGQRVAVFRFAVAASRLKYGARPASSELRCGRPRIARGACGPFLSRCIRQAGLRIRFAFSFRVPRYGSHQGTCRRRLGASGDAHYAHGKE